MTPAERNAVLEEAAQLIGPKGPRPCDCDPFHCYCGNYGDAQSVAAWDEAELSAAAIRALKEQEPKE